MRVDQRTQAGATAGSIGAAESSSAAGTAGLARGEANSSQGSDTVNLSGPLRVLQHSASDRTSRIAALTASVRGGTYAVSSQQISGALIQETLGRVSG